jgi:predicted negative regulator of RcsB-dependent stress response
LTRAGALMMSKLIDYVDFLIIAVLIVLCVYVGWKAFESMPRAQTQALTMAYAIAKAAPTAISI